MFWKVDRERINKKKESVFHLICYDAYVYNCKATAKLEANDKV